MVDRMIEEIRRMPIETQYKVQLVALVTVLQTKYEWERQEGMKDG